MRRKTLTRHAPQLGADASLSAEDAAKRTPAHVAAFNEAGAACKSCSSRKIQQGMGDRICIYHAVALQHMRGVNARHGSLAQLLASSFFTTHAPSASYTLPALHHARVCTA